MTVYALVSAIILSVLGLTILLSLGIIVLMILRTLRAVTLIRQQMRPLTRQIKLLVLTGKRLTGKVQQSASAVKIEVAEARAEVTHNAGRVAWLYQQVIFTPIITRVARLLNLPGESKVSPEIAQISRQISPPATGETILVKPEEPPLIAVEKEPFRKAA